MALIKCPECGMEISDKAASCPVCGYPMQPVTSGNAPAGAQPKASGDGTANPQPQPAPVYQNAAPTYQNPAPQPQRPVPKKKESALGIIGLILSVFFCLPVIPVVGLVLCIIAIRDKKHSSTCATIGLIICIFSILLGILAPKYTEYVNEAREESQTVSSIDATDAEAPSQESADAVTSESADLPTSTETVSREDFIASCEEIPYKTLARYPEDNTGKHIVLTVQITQIVQGGLFDNSVYYRVYTDNDGYGLYLSDEYLMYDARIDDDTKLLEDDIIKVYGEFIGTESIVRALTGTSEEVPAFKAYYIDILDLVEDDKEYVTLEKYDQIENGMSYDEVVEIIGAEGTVLSSIEMDSMITTYVWYAEDGFSNATVVFGGDAVTSKMQVGLD